MLGSIHNGTLAKTVNLFVYRNCYRKLCIGIIRSKLRLVIGHYCVSLSRIRASFDRAFIVVSPPAEHTGTTYEVKTKIKTVKPKLKPPKHVAFSSFSVFGEAQAL